MALHNWTHLDLLPDTLWGLHAHPTKTSNTTEDCFKCINVFNTMYLTFYISINYVYV